MHVRRQGSGRRTNSSKNTASTQNPHYNNTQNIQQYMMSNTGSIPSNIANQIMHSSVGNMAMGQVQNSSALNAGVVSAGIYKTNTLD